MQIPTQATNLKRPQIIQSLMAGFDVVANNVYLLILPILLDLLLWFGPHVRVLRLVELWLINFDEVVKSAPPNLLEMVKESRMIWQLIGEQFNLLTVLRTYPIGVPSMLVSELATKNPLGVPLAVDTSSFGDLLIIWLVLSLIGLLLGSLFFLLIKRAVLKESAAITAGALGWLCLQVLYLALTALIVLLVIGIPAMMLISVLTLINPIIGQMVLFIGGLAALWLLIPLLFAPHGIFLNHQNFLRSTLTSVQVVRFALTGAGLFFVATILISQGLDLLWQVPEQTSWLKLIGIAGHAFINTGLIAASFVYYREGVAYVDQMIAKNSTSPIRPA